MLERATAEALIQAAQNVAQKAYAPYSNFHVGAALLTQDGEIITGANVENVSYGLTVCAERVAIGKAVIEGHRQFPAIAVWAQVMPNGAVTPCGACRQVLAEFMKPDGLIVMADAKQPGSIRQVTIATLLPEAFAPDLAPNGLD